MSLNGTLIHREARPFTHFVMQSLKFLDEDRSSTHEAVELWVDVGHAGDDVYDFAKSLPQQLAENNRHFA